MTTMCIYLGPKRWDLIGTIVDYFFDYFSYFNDQLGMLSRKDRVSTRRKIYKLHLEKENKFDIYSQNT